jgi:hypothetical protein
MSNAQWARPDRPEMHRNTALTILALSFAGAVSSGCYSRDPMSLTSTSAPSLIPAIKNAANQNDKKAIPGIVDNLDSNDSAVRFAAISALNKMTGQDFGYRYYDCQSDRQASIEKWRGWLKDHPV